MAQALSPLIRFMQAKVQSYQGKTDTPFISGIQEVLATLGNDISPELSQHIINLMSESSSNTHILRRAVSKNRN